MGRMLAQLLPNRAEYLSNLGDKVEIPRKNLVQRKLAVWRAFPAFPANLLQSKVSYG
jgi:hypothetical protein